MFILLCKQNKSRIMQEEIKFKRTTGYTSLDYKRNKHNKAIKYIISHETLITELTGNTMFFKCPARVSHSNSPLPIKRIDCTKTSMRLGGCLLINMFQDKKKNN